MGPKLNTIFVVFSVYFLIGILNRKIKVPIEINIEQINLQKNWEIKITFFTIIIARNINKPSSFLLWQVNWGQTLYRYSCVYKIIKLRQVLRVWTDLKRQLVTQSYWEELKLYAWVSKNSFMCFTWIDHGKLLDVARGNRTISWVFLSL